MQPRQEVPSVLYIPQAFLLPADYEVTYKILGGKSRHLIYIFFLFIYGLDLLFISGCNINLLKPTGQVMHQQFNIQQF